MWIVTVAPVISMSSRSWTLVRLTAGTCARAFWHLLIPGPCFARFCCKLHESLHVLSKAEGSADKVLGMIT